MNPPTNKIARVFPTKTSMTPDDTDVYFGPPPALIPHYDEIHISVTFTWDITKALWLKQQWENKGKVRVDGPAINGSTGDFVAGRYLRPGITITSRGCPNRCPWCLVPEQEGGLRELPIVPGNIIQDNNILACSKEHLRKVFDMLRGQRAIEFKGGLQANLVTEEIADQLRQLSIKSLWLACDTKAALPITKRAIAILHDAGFTINHIYCYVLIGRNMTEEERRLKEIYEAGAVPFAQLLRNRDDSICYPKNWQRFQRQWSRPAIIKGKEPEEQRGLFEGIAD